MGVRGLKTFLERNSGTRIIRIEEEIDKWKRDHADQTPTIVIDFLSITLWAAEKKIDIFCGGRPKIAMKDWKNKLDLFKSTGCSLVFFTHLRTEDGKIDEKLRRANANFDTCTAFYDRIDDHQTLQKIVDEITDFKEITAIYEGLRKIAATYGDFHISVDHECDLEIARYAKERNAMAIMSEDTDFLIFNGPWKLWSTHDTQITESGQIQTTEYKENAVSNTCKLCQNQLPLFATLLTNDYTRIYFDRLKLTALYGEFRYRVQNVARYVRKIDCARLSDFDIRHITRDALGEVDANFQRLIKQSLESYNINAPNATPRDDPIERLLSGTNMYRSYMKTMKTIQTISMKYYDMRDSDSGATFVGLKLDWTKRHIGIVRQHTRDDSFTFIILLKKNIAEDFKSHTESPIYPDFVVPSLDQLYLAPNDIELTEMKWKIFAWIMSFSDQEISMLKQLPKDFLLISTTLYTLVKNDLFTAEEADAILYTEKMVFENKTEDVEYPIVLQTRYVRVAHTYNYFFKDVLRNFTVAGLQSFVQDTFQFDGVYFQKLTETINMMNNTERASFLEHINSYRIYAEI